MRARKQQTSNAEVPGATYRLLYCVITGRTCIYRGNTWFAHVAHVIPDPEAAHGTEMHKCRDEISPSMSRGLVFVALPVKKSPRMLGESACVGE